MLTAAAFAFSVLCYTDLHHFFSVYSILFSRTPDPVGLVKPLLHGNNLELE